MYAANLTARFPVDQLIALDGPLGFMKRLPCGAYSPPTCVARQLLHVDRRTPLTRPPHGRLNLNIHVDISVWSRLFATDRHHCVINGPRPGSSCCAGLDGLVPGLDRGLRNVRLS